MKISAYIKHLSVAMLVLGVAAGCASSAEKTMDECTGMSADVQAAIDEAKSVNADARSMGADWRGARKIINSAEEAGENCNDDKAMQYANEARLMAKEAIESHRAMEQDQSMDENEMESDRSYTVERGDTLWGISGSSVGYNDPYQWPLIYRANQNRIDDADLIYPDQRLTIEANPSASDVDAAIEHAKTRGEWSLGMSEDSDEAYLENN